MPLIKRSYEKESKMLNGKNFVCRDLFGEYLDKNPYGQGYDRGRALKGLTFDGKRIITSFINQNIEKEKMLMKQEQKVIDDLHDHKTPKNKIPFWKNGLHVMEHFGPPLIDKVYKFKAPPIIKYDLVQPPFRRPKAEGDYIDKDIRPLGP